MPFSIRKEQSTKCHSCVNSHIVKTEQQNDEVVICRLMGHPVAPISECNQFLPLIHAGVPGHMLAQAWLMKDQERGDKKVGFAPPRILVNDDD